MNTKQKRKRNKPDPLLLAEIVKRIVRAAKPERIVLFGSAARGTMGPHSDIDVLVIRRGTFHHRRLRRLIRDGLDDVEISVDVVVATPDEVERYRNSPCIVVCPAMREGKVLYESTARPRRSA